MSRALEWDIPCIVDPSLSNHLLTTSLPKIHTRRFYRPTLILTQSLEDLLRLDLQSEQERVHNSGVDRLDHPGAVNVTVAKVGGEEKVE
eukprot:850599-Amorphochlora_amoeboformis.AAC.4